MDTQDKVDKDFKKAFNLGYELAKELDLKSAMFKNQNAANSPSNAMHVGMLQYIDEISHSKKLKVDKSVSNGKTILNQRVGGENKNRGKGLTP